MRRKINRIASYRTMQGAERYARDLRIVWPMYKFEPTQHPYDFTYTVVLKCGFNFAGRAYVLHRPRGGVQSLGYTGH
jgi:hypothetical protein